MGTPTSSGQETDGAISNISINDPGAKDCANMAAVSSTGLFCIIEERNSPKGTYGGRGTVRGAQYVEQSTSVRHGNLSGFVAAYLMYRRGESMFSIARNAVTNPVGLLVSEVKNVV